MSRKQGMSASSDSQKRDDLSTKMDALLVAKNDMLMELNNLEETQATIVEVTPVVSKNVQTIGTIIWKRYPDDRKRPGSLQNLHDRTDRPDRTQFYPSDAGHLSRPGRLRSSG